MLALAIDEFVSELQNLSREELEELILSIPPSEIDDQLDAAIAESFDRAGSLLGGIAGVRTAAGWMRLGACVAVADWIEGRARTCEHQPHPMRPEPVYACAWKPELVVCADCMYLLDPDTAESDATCDGCGHRCVGVGAGDGIHPGALVFGPLTFLSGMCERCYAEVRRRENSDAGLAGDHRRKVHLVGERVGVQSHPIKVTIDSVGEEVPRRGDAVVPTNEHLHRFEQRPVGRLIVHHVHLHMFGRSVHAVLLKRGRTISPDHDCPAPTRPPPCPARAGQGQRCCRIARACVTSIAAAQMRDLNKRVVLGVDDQAALAGTPPLRLEMERLADRRT